MSFEAYHGVTGAQHQTRFNNLSQRGFRMISLSVHGDAGSPRYSAVWVQRAGAGWVAVHGVDAAGYQSWFNTWRQRGYAPVIVSATGTAAKAVFAAVMELGIAGFWEARHGLTSGPETNPGTFQYQNKAARAAGLIPRSVAIYGTGADRRYAGVWHSNPGFTKWIANPSDTASGYQTTFNAQTQLPGIAPNGWRPAYVALSGDGIYCSVFRDDVVGEWRARHGLTAAAYQAEFDRNVKAGFYPICVQGGGSGSNTRYAAVFAKQDIPAARQWTATGTEAPGLAGFDNLMQSFMRANGVRAAQLSIGSKKGTIRFARAYTWAEPGYPITQPSDRFMLASCSKMFLCAAIQSLYDSKKLTPGRRAYSVLGFTKPLDADSDKITVQQLLDHMGGWDVQASGYDATYSMRQIAEDMKLKKPVTKLDVATWMYKHRKLDFVPGKNTKYSNYGYLLASAIVEKVTGKGYFEYLKTILDADKIADVRVSPTEAAGWPGNEAIVEDPALGLSPLDLSSNAQVPAVYGGDGMIKGVAAASCGLAASATAMTKFIRRHAVWGNGGRMANSGRSGSTPGSSTMAVSRADGVDWAFTINTRTWPPSASSTVVSDLAGAINNLLNNTPIPELNLKLEATTTLNPAAKQATVTKAAARTRTRPRKKAPAVTKTTAAKTTASATSAVTRATAVKSSAGSGLR